MTNQRPGSAGFTLFEMLVVMFVLAVLLAFGMPRFSSLRTAMAFTSATEEIAAALSRARWMAITSGRPATTVELTSSTLLSIRSGGTVLASSDVSGSGVSLVGANLPFSFDNRGFVSGAVPTITVTNSAISASTVLTIGPLGKVERP